MDLDRPGFSRSLGPADRRSALLADCLAPPGYQQLYHKPPTGLTASRRWTGLDRPDVSRSPGPPGRQPALLAACLAHAGCRQLDHRLPTNPAANRPWIGFDRLI